jgi:molybdenum cofactor cytidylyltransferase
MIFAVIPAAGKSRRMGQPKLSLLLGDRTVLEHVLSALREGGVEQSLVIVGPNSLDLIVLAERAGGTVCKLPEETADMRSTVEFGLHWIEYHFRPRCEDAFLLVPADHPTLDPLVVRTLLAARSNDREPTVFIPTYGGKRGHPALIGWTHVSGIRAHPAGEGLSSYLRQVVAQTVEVPVETASILGDLDTPEDYERLRRQWLDRSSR